MSAVLCPTCRSRRVERTVRTFPFCSPGCRDRDLSAWVEEKYRIPVERAGESEREGGEPPPSERE